MIDIIIDSSYRGAGLNRAVESHVHLAPELSLLVPLDIFEFRNFKQFWMFGILNVFAKYEIDNHGDDDGYSIR